MKKLISFVLIITLCLSMSIPVVASDNEPQENKRYSFLPEFNESDEQFTEMLDVIVYDSPIALEDEQAGLTLLLSGDEIIAMSAEELTTALLEITPMSYMQASELADQMKNGSPSRGYGIYDFPEWYITPYVTSSVLWVTYSTSWIGIDAYRSSVGMTKGNTETKTINYTLGFSGSAEIKSFKPSLTFSYNTSYTTTISSSQTCPAWTTMNWRPYSTWYLDEYYGKMKITTIIPLPGGGVYQNVWYDDHTGTDRRIVTETTELWSRVNTAQNINAPTPQPPTTAPPV